MERGYERRKEAEGEREKDIRGILSDTMLTNKIETRGYALMEKKNYIIILMTKFTNVHAINRNKNSRLANCP